MASGGARTRVRSFRTMAVVVVLSVTATLMAGVTGTALAAPTTTSFTATADAFVSTAFPTTNYGTATELRMSNPQRSSYVKFNLSGLSGTVTSAALQFSAPATSALGFDVRSVSDSSWGELTVTQSNAPAMGPIVASSGAFGIGTFSIDVTPQVSGNGLLSFGLTRTSANLITVSSREAGVTSAPTLVVTTDAAPPPPGSTATFTTTADAFVSTAFPAQNFGGATDLRMSNPQRSSYVKFNVTGLAGSVSSAVLHFNAPASSALGFDVRPVSDSSWGEMTITNNNAPAMGPVAAPTGAFGVGPFSVDVTSLVSGNGLISFGLTRTSANLITVSSREAGASTAPTLEVTTGTAGGGGGTDTEAPSAPTAFGGLRPLDAHQITLFWDPSTDNVGVTGYTIYRDGQPYATAGPGATAYIDANVVNGQTYIYWVDAFDAAGNHSDISNTDTITDALCNLCVLDPTAHHAMEVNGGSVLMGPFSRLWVDSSDREAADATGGSHVTAGKSIQVVGNFHVSGGSVFSPTPTIHAPVAADPLINAPTPTTTGPSFGNKSVGGGNVTLNPGTYGTLSINGGNVTMNPGVYVITGGLSVNGSSHLTGNGVILYFTGHAGYHLSGGTVTTLTSPKKAGTGTSDMVVQASRTNTAEFKSDDVTATFNGHLYAPAGKLTVQALKVVDDIVIVRTIEVHSGGDFCLCS